MTLREIHKVLNLSQSKLMQGQKSELNEQEVAILHGIYKSRGGKGIVKGLTPEQIVISSATNFYVKELQRKVSGRENKSAIITDLCERLKETAKAIGVDVNYKLEIKSPRNSFKMCLTNDVKCTFKTGREEKEPYIIALSIGNNTFVADYKMIVEDMFVGLLGVKGCAFANTYVIVNIVGQMLRRAYA